MAYIKNSLNTLQNYFSGLWYCMMQIRELGDFHQLSLLTDKNLIFPGYFINLNYKGLFTVSLYV